MARPKQMFDGAIEARCFVATMIARFVSIRTSGKFERF
jgi:hypothetical protein